MLPKFKIGDKVYVLPDIENVCIVTKREEGPYQFFYEVQEIVEGWTRKANESELEAAE